MPARPPIPEKWIRDYVDQLLEVAKGLPDSSLIKKAAIERADHVMDLVKAWRGYCRKDRQDASDSNTTP